jgi:MFS family permease
MRRLLARRDTRLYLAGQALSLFGDTAMWLALGIWAKELTGSSGAAGMVIFALALPQLAAPAAGLLVDRVRRRPLLIATNLAMAVAVLPLLAVHDRGDLWLIYAVAVAYGASYSILGAGQTALLATILPADLLVEANGALQTLRETQRLIAPLVGAGLFSALGGGAVALVDAATFVAAAAALVAMRTHEPAPAPRAPHPLAEAMAGARHLRATVALRQMVLACALSLGVLGLSETLVYAIADAGLHRSPSFVGVLIAGQGVGAIAGATTAARVARRTGERILAGLGMAAIAVGALLMASGALAVVLAGKILFGAGTAWLIVGAITLLQRLTPARLQGRVYSAAELLMGAPQTLSIAAGAALVTVVDYRWLLLAQAAVMAACATYLLSRPEQRGRPLRHAQRRALGALGVREGDLEEGLARRRLAAPGAPDQRDRPRQALGADRAQLDRWAGLLGDRTRDDGDAEALARQRPDRPHLRADEGVVGLEAARGHRALQAAAQRRVVAVRD